MKKTILTLIVVALLCTSCVPNNSPKPQTSSSIIENSSSEIDKEAEALKEAETLKEAERLKEKEAKKLKDKEDEEILKKVIVTNDNQGVLNGKIKHIVWVENKSDKIIVDVNVHVRYKSDGSTIESDTFFVEDLKPNDKTYGIIFTDLYENIEFSSNFGTPTFKEDTASANGKYNKELSKTLKQEIKDGFGFKGSETSWYKDIGKIKVYKTTSGNYAEVICTSTDDEIIERITYVILNSSDVVLFKVITYDEEGNILFQKSK